MPASGITVLKNNAPWGPFTREQIDDGLARGDFTLKYLAHAPGLKEWHPLGEVLDHVDKISGPRIPVLPPVPSEVRELPPVPSDPPREKPEPPVLSQPAVAPTPILPPPLPPVEKRAVPQPVAETPRETASIFRRGFAFLVDAAVLFVPLAILYGLGGLMIEVPGAWHHISHQARMDEWEFLNLNTQRLFWIDAIGFGWLYGAGLEASRSQATIGKRWVGIIVTDLAGERMSFVRATGRYAAKYLSALPFFLGFIMALFSSRNLTLHDRLSGTRVVRK